MTATAKHISSSAKQHGHSGSQSMLCRGGKSFINGSFIQPKLTVNTPGDRYEREADAMADRIMRMPMDKGQVRPTQGLLASSVQRKCSACEEEEKKKKTVMRKADGSNGVPTTPNLASSLSATKGGGSPLPGSTRSFMENAFSTNFSQVRVHTDSRAAEMSQGIQAKAFTHGSDVYFNKGQYQPANGEGKRLLAHELTHVVQQGGDNKPDVQRHAISPLDEDLILRSVFNPLYDDFESEYYNTGLRYDRAGSETMSYSESTELATCTRILGPGSYEDCYYDVFGVFLDPYGPLAQAHAQYMAESCTHDASALTWADFQATPPSSHFSAETHFDFSLYTVSGQQVIRANYLPQRSWVKAQFANPTDRQVNGCAGNVSACEDFFDEEAQAGRTGGTFNLRAPTGCDASISPNTSLNATSRSECDSVLGTECDRVAQLESQRLLRHEQYHYKLACELARKGTEAILDGQDPDQVLRAVRRQANSLTDDYDDETAHGCNQADQTSWESRIDSGFPNVTI